MALTLWSAARGRSDGGPGVAASQARRRRGRRWVPAAMVVLTTVGSAIGVASPAGTASPTWKIVPTPNPAGSIDAKFEAVSCTSPTNCFAVGEYATSTSGNLTLVERWNGTKWSIVASPNPVNSTDDRLSSVSCTSTTSCFAVGRYGSNSLGVFRGLIERWNGAKWSIVPSPNEGTSEMYLSGVSCATETSCFAVGYYNGFPGGGVFERWAGSRWSLTAPMQVDPTGVSCAGPTFCIAVGAQGLLFPWIDRWDGSTWSTVTVPSLTERSGDLLGVSCSSATNCIAVGQTDLSAGHAPTLTVRWNGKRWSVVASPNPAESFLLGVSCTSAASCIATGGFLERWNGTRWSILAYPDVPPGTSPWASGAVSCTSATFCMTVSYQNSGRLLTTLAARYA